MRKGLSISLIPLVLRHVNGIRRVASIVGKQAISQLEFAEKCRRYQQEASAHVDSLSRVAEAIWNTEGLSITFAKHGLFENTLNDSRIPRESLGIAHVGYGIVSAEYVRFNIEKLREILETKCEPNYRGFACEGIGSALLLYEPGFFRVLNRAIGVVPRGAPVSPDKTGFFAKFFSAFPPEAQRQLAHGYGRLTGFSTLSVYKTIRDGLGLPPEHAKPFIQGVAVAYGMLNCLDLPRLLDNSDSLSPEPIRATFQNGLVWVLSYCDWFAPGLLAAWRPQGRLEEKLLELARGESAFNRKRGYPLVGALENPIGASAERRAPV